MSASSGLSCDHPQAGSVRERSREMCCNVPGVGHEREREELTGGLHCVALKSQQGWVEKLMTVSAPKTSAVASKKCELPEQQREVPGQRPAIQLGIKTKVQSILRLVCEWGCGPSYSFGVHLDL